jgi:hypothetical protein
MTRRNTITVCMLHIRRPNASHLLHMSRRAVHSAESVGLHISLYVAVARLQIAAGPFCRTVVCGAGHAGHYAGRRRKLPKHHLSALPNAKNESGVADDDDAGHQHEAHGLVVVPAALQRHGAKQTEIEADSDPQLIVLSLSLFGP